MGVGVGLHEGTEDPENGKKIPKKNIQPCLFLSVIKPSVNARTHDHRNSVAADRFRRRRDDVLMLAPDAEGLVPVTSERFLLGRPRAMSRVLSEGPGENGATPIRGRSPMRPRTEPLSSPGHAKAKPRERFRSV